MLTSKIRLLFLTMYNQQRVGTRFYTELVNVLHIIQTKPTSIIDDTAIERLLTFLDGISKYDAERLFQTCEGFLLSDDIWKNETSLAFALRLAGYLGRDKKSSTTTPINTLITKLTHHELVKDAPVKHAFLFALECFTLNPEWLSFIKDFLPLILSGSNNCSMFVKKATEKFFASYLSAVIQCNGELDEITELLLKENEYLDLYCRSIVQLLNKSFEHGVTVLSRTQILFTIGKEIVKHGDKDLLVSYINLLDTLTSSTIAVNMQQVMKVTNDNVEEFFRTFLRHVQSSEKLNDQYPALCDSLVASEKSSLFSMKWNAEMLNNILSPVLNNTGNLATKIWKKLFVSTITLACKFHQKVHWDATCLKTITEWCRFCLKLLLISTNQFDETIPEYLHSVVDDQKIPRLIFHYLNSLADIPEKLTEDILTTLWICLSSPATIHTQTICSTLDLLTKLVEADDNNFVTLQIIETVRERHQATNTLADVLALKLWDMNWEIKDSLLGFLIQLVRNARAGRVSTKNFLLKYTFWCSAISMFHNEESFVRAKCITFFTEVYLSVPLWKMYMQFNEVDKLSLWHEFHQIFRDPRFTDDIFTRRSILQSISKICQSNRLFTSFNKDVVIFNQCDTSCIFPILHHAHTDLDWEVRKLYYLTLSSIVDGLTDYKGKELVIEKFVHSQSAKNVILGLYDCEIEVKKAALKLIQKLMDVTQEKKKIPENSEPPVKMFKSIADSRFTISSIEDIEIFWSLKSPVPVKSMKNLKREDFLDFLKSLADDFIPYTFHTLEEIDADVKKPLSFLKDIISSTKQLEGNLLDCY